MAVLDLLTDQPLADRRALRRRLLEDSDGAFHRDIVRALGLPQAALPPALRRLPRRQPSRRATQSLLRVLGVTVRAHALFGDIAPTRRWLATPLAMRGGPRGFPLADVMRPAHRRVLVTAIRRTAHGIY
ncbi:hypothetical protein [Luteibacter yeojuensis]|uniref:Antitoxin Xre/MbcA/ParS-like toxin-binding domain-containing protein n=1 Tax=Luteibacter yeojuensis TaxID=345309 RepID=A0A0F3KJA5_9GAMM|nr:hypothetical protein [Luteibacter yeojuensis]KJV31298.1 hypothetical protein VI08_13670 [Luteibacter yeojuensis]